jgi:hypothetical protein
MGDRPVYKERSFAFVSSVFVLKKHFSHVH